MTPPTVLLDRSFLAVLVDPQHADHDRVAQQYSMLLDAYEDHEIRLRARADHLLDVGAEQHGDLFAPIESIHVAGQFHRQAARLAPRLGDSYEPDLALTLVIMRRESIDRIATFEPFFDTLEVTVER
jgi:hypothetical protein